MDLIQLCSFHSDVSVCLCERMLMSLYVWVVFKDKTMCFLIISKEHKTVVNI